MPMASDASCPPGLRSRQLLERIVLTASLATRSALMTLRGGARALWRPRVSWVTSLQQRSHGIARQQQLEHTITWYCPSLLQRSHGFARQQQRSAPIAHTHDAAPDHLASIKVQHVVHQGPSCGPSTLWCGGAAASANRDERWRTSEPLRNWFD